MNPIRVAVVQATPQLFDTAATLARTLQLGREAAAQGARLVLFPEAFLPPYPRGFGFGATVGNRTAEGRELWRRLWEQAVDVPGPETQALSALARDAGLHLAVGAIERDSAGSRGTLYCTLLLFGPGGELLLRHRKIKPTASERLIWGEGDGRSLRVVPTELGRVGGLICWENYLPLARMALYAQGVEIYLAPTADPRPSWQATLQHIACEGRCFVLGGNQFLARAHYPPDLRDHPDLAALPETPCAGGSAIVSPLGAYLAGPVYDREEILIADLDRDEIVRSKFDLDVAGHYARPDIFELRVHGQPISEG